MNEASCTIHDLTKTARNLVSYGSSLGRKHGFDHLKKSRFSFHIATLANGIIKNVHEGSLSAWEGMQQLLAEFEELRAKAWFYAKNGGMQGRDYEPPYKPMRRAKGGKLALFFESLIATGSDSSPDGNSAPPDVKPAATMASTDVKPATTMASTGTHTNTSKGDAARVMLSHLAKLASPLIPPVLQGSNVSEYTCDIPPEGLTGLMSLTTPPEKTEPIVCTHPDMMEQLASYIADEMNRNIHHSSVLQMKELLSYDVAEETRKFMELPWYAQAGASSPQVIGAANAAAAMALWTERVGQGMEWDHKKKIPNIIGGIWHKQGDYNYFYDIWSNIHYGYVGRAGGLSESVLSDGAGVEQIASESIRKIKDWEERQWPDATEGVDGMRAYDDDPDRISINIGLELFTEHPNGGITAQMIMEKVLAVNPEDWGDGTRAHDCKTYK